MDRPVVPGRLTLCAPLSRSWRADVRFQTDKQRDVRPSLRVRVAADDSSHDAAHQYSTACDLPLNLPSARKSIIADVSRSTWIPRYLDRFWYPGICRLGRNCECGQ